MAEKLYVSIANQLRAEIEQGVLSGQLPSESTLQTKFGVSRSVIRQALAVLARGGLIAKAQGKPSEVRAPASIHRVVHSLNGLGLQAERLGRSVTTHVLSFQATTDDEFVRDWGSNRTIAIRRVRIIDGNPFAVIETTVPRAPFEGVDASDLEDVSLHQTLAERGGVELKSSKRSIRAGLTNESLADTLRIPLGSPTLILEGRTFDKDGRLVEVFTTTHRADYVVFDLETQIEA